MKQRFWRSFGFWGWLGLVGYIAAFDFYSPQTLSDAWYKSVLHPKHRWPVIFLWASVTLHLFHLIPHKVDWIDHIGAQMSKYKRR